MKNKTVFGNYEHYQIEITISIDLGSKGKFESKGYSSLDACITFLSRPRADRIITVRAQVKDSIFSAFKKFELHDNGIKYDAGLLKNAKYAIVDAAIVTRQFIDMSGVVETQLSKGRFRELYKEYRDLYGHGFKSKLAAKFGIKPRSIENYLQGRIPKTARFTEGIRLMRTVEDIPSKFQFNFTCHDGLDASLYLDKTGLLRALISRMDKSIIKRWIWSDFFAQMSGMVTGCINTKVISWLINL